MTRHFARDKDLTDNQEGKVDPAYLAEVEMQTDRREREYAATLRRLEAAEQRHMAAQYALEVSRTKGERTKHERAVQRAWELVAERMRELRVLEALMTELPASREHRGSGHPKHRA
jgi:hypothetical protein